VKKDRLPKIDATAYDLIESSIQKKPVDELSSTIPVSLTSDPEGNEPLLKRIHTLNQRKTDEVSEGNGTGSEGLYIYGIAENAAAAESLQATGIDGQDVDSIRYRDLMAIVHDCPARPYESTDKEVVKDWVLAHEKIIERVSGHCGSVMPFCFDTIIKPDGNKTAQEMLLHWMSEEYERLEIRINKISGKKEYGVQIFYSLSLMGDRVAGMNPTIKNLQEEMNHRGPGMEYMVRQKIEQELKTGMESEAASLVHDCYKKSKDACDNVKIEKIKKSEEKDQKMLINCSCLVSDENYTKLGEVLEDIGKGEGIFVRFTGPWPVYSFEDS